MSTTPSNSPANGQIFRHTDGGIYRFMTLAKHSEDQSLLCIYEHLWPYAAQEPWARPLNEWASRFTPMSQQEYEDATKGDRVGAQLAVAQAKKARRAAANASK